MKKKFDDPRAYFFQNPDNRIIFAIPYETDFTLIGTTDSDYTGDPEEHPDHRGRDRLSLQCGKRVFRRARQAVRCRLDLFRRASALRRRCVEGAGSHARLRAEDRANNGDAPLLNVFGGKLTTYRRLGRACAGKDRGRDRCQGRPVDGEERAAGRRFPGDWLRG